MKIDIIWWQRKVVWFWDDNLTINRPYIKQLLTEMISLKKWWLTQASMDIAKDQELLDLMRDSGCIGVFLGIESFGADSLVDANKKQNKTAHYKKAVKEIRKRGIALMALWKKSFSPRYSLQRIIRATFSLRWGALLLSLFMNSFYTYKRLSKNYPIDMSRRSDLNQLIKPIPTSKAITPS